MEKGAEQACWTPGCDGPAVRTIRGQFPMCTTCADRAARFSVEVGQRRTMSENSQTSPEARRVAAATRELAASS